MASRTTRTDPLRTLVIAPNGSLTVPQAQWFFVGICVLTTVIASVLTLWGLWMVWPFAFLYMGMLGVGLFMSMRDNGYREIVSVYEDMIEVEAGRGRPERHWEFPRLLTQVQLRVGGSRNSPSRLLITRYGRGCELGRCLTDDERAEVASRIRNWVHVPELEKMGDGERR